MKFLSFIQNLIFKLNHQHLLTNGAGGVPTVNKPNSTGGSTFNQFINILWEEIKRQGEKLIRNVYLVFVKFVYFLVKLTYNILDFVMVFVKELSGQAQAINVSRANTNLTESDVIFKFILNSYTMKIFKRVLIYSIFLLILVTIFALIVNEWKKATSGDGRDYRAILINSVKSIFTMFITPFVVVLGILFSNILLSSCINLVDDNMHANPNYSIGSTLFISGTYGANQYRLYAERGAKIPILFGFNGGLYDAQNVEVDYTKTKSFEELESSLANSDYLTSGYSTYSMFKNDDWLDFEQIGEDSSYYAVYDGQFLKTKKIEYYVMADFVDYAMETGEGFVIKNVEDVYETARSAILDGNAKNNPYLMKYFVGQEVDYGDFFDKVDPNSKDFKATVEQYNFYFDSVFDHISPVSKDGQILDSQSSVEDITQYAFASEGVEYNPEYYNVYVDYNQQKASQIKENLPEERYTYKSYSGMTDEAYGACYVMCLPVSIQINVEDPAFTTIYIPVQNGVYYNNTFIFNSSFLNEGSIFLSRGAFTLTGYPTAIKESGADIVYYRHDVSAPLNLGIWPKSTYTSNDAENETILSSGNDIFSQTLGLDAGSLTYNFDANVSSNISFNKSIIDMATFKNGYYTLNYSFVDTPLAVDNVYDLANVNILVLVLTSASLTTTLLATIWGLLKRILEITVYWFTLPAWVVKYPLETSKSVLSSPTFKAWRDHFISCVIIVYSKFLGLVFYLFLVRNFIQIDFSSGISIDLAGNMFSYISPALVQWIVKVMFILVLFTLVETITSEVQKLVGGDEVIDFSIYAFRNDRDAIAGNLKSARETFTIGGQLKKAKAELGKGFETARSFLPGRALIDGVVGAGTDVARKVETARLNSQANRFAGLMTGGGLTANQKQAEVNALKAQQNKFEKNEAKRQNLVNFVRGPFKDKRK